MSAAIHDKKISFSMTNDLSITLSLKDPENDNGINHSPTIQVSVWDSQGKTFHEEEVENFNEVVSVVHKAQMIWKLLRKEEKVCL